MSSIKRIRDGTRRADTCGLSSGLESNKDCTSIQLSLPLKKTFEPLATFNKQNLQLTF